MMDNCILSTNPRLVLSDTLITLWRNGRSISALRRLFPDLAALDSRTISRAIKRQTTTEDSVIRRRKNGGIPIPEWWTTEAQGMYLDGASSDEIAKAVKKRASTVRHWVANMPQQDRSARRQKIAERNKQKKKKRKDELSTLWSMWKRTDPRIGQIYVAQPSHAKNMRIWWPSGQTRRAQWQQLDKGRWGACPLATQQAVYYAEILAEAMQEHETR